MTQPTEPTTDAPEEPATGTSDGDEGGTTTDDTKPAAADVGDAGKKAIAAERTKARTEAKRRRELEAELAALRASTAKKADADETVDPKAIAEAARAEARAEVLKDRALDKIEVLAAKTFANPDLARRLLQSDVDQFIGDGKVDTEAIKDALAEYLEANPGLAIVPPKRFNGGADQGPRGKTAAPDLDTQIAAAVKAGDIREQLRLQNMKLIPHAMRMWGAGT